MCKLTTHNTERVLCMIKCCLSTITYDGNANLKEKQNETSGHNGGNEFAKEPFGDVKVCHLGGYNANV